MIPSLEAFILFACLTSSMSIEKISALRRA